MNYNQVGIANLALNLIGARGDIVDINENSPNAKKVLVVWDAIFQEVLSERDWKFAKTRTSLQLVLNPQTGQPLKPLYAYHYAWSMPSDYLRFVRPRRRPNRDCFWYGWGTFPGWYHREDWPFHPYVDYKVEAINQLDSSGNPTGNYIQCALCDYSGNCGPAKINYIRLITDYTQLLPGFVNCLSYRLAQKLAISITEDMRKMQAMEALYKDSLNSAEAQNECMDYEKDEAGSESWVRAGRYVTSAWRGGGWWGQ